MDAQTQFVTLVTIYLDAIIKDDRIEDFTIDAELKTQIVASAMMIPIEIVPVTKSDGYLDAAIDFVQFDAGINKGETPEWLSAWFKDTRWQ